MCKKNSGQMRTPKENAKGGEKDYTSKLKKKKKKGGMEIKKEDQSTPGKLH